MSRVRSIIAVMGIFVSISAVEVFTARAAMAAPTTPVSITTCPGTTSSGTFTLTANCDTTASLTVPPTITTVDGNGKTITAHDPAAPDFLQGGVLTNLTAGQSMTIKNLTIQGTGFTPVPGCGRGSLFGIHFNDASGSVDSVTVEGITEDSGCNPTTGIAIRADGVSAARTVSISNTTVTGYQRNGLDARGSMTMDVSTSTVGPPEDLNDVIAENGVVYWTTGSGQPGGTISDSTIFGIGDAIQSVSATAILLSGAKNVTITNNTLTSDPTQRGTDVGIYVWLNSSAITISHNHITRSAPDVPDTDGQGVFVDDTTSSATLICNTFDNWKTNIVGAIQIACTPLSDGTVDTPYSANAPAVEGGTGPFTWTITAGSLPPGLTLADDGTITGTPTEAGTFNFTLSVADANGLTATSDTSITVAPLPATTTTTTTTTTTIPSTTSSGVSTTVPASTTTAGGTTTPAADTTTGPPPSGTALPFTGSGTGPALFGIAVLLTGAVLIARNRRRR